MLQQEGCPIRPPPSCTAISVPFYLATSPPPPSPSPSLQAMRAELASEPHTLFVVAAYHIGKERAFLGAAEQLGVKVGAGEGAGGPALNGIRPHGADDVT